MTSIPAEIAGLIVFVLSILKCALCIGVLFMPFLWWIAERRYR